MAQVQFDYSTLWDEPVASPTVKEVKKTYKNTHRRGKFVVKLCICFFIYALILVFLCIKGATLGYQIVALENDIKYYEAQNNRMKYNIQGVSALDKVELIAINELGMYKPEKHLTIAYTAPAVNQVLDNENTDGTVGGESLQENTEIANKPLYKIYANLLLLAEKN
ncbi:MAG: hypothetical protein GX333_00110 [Syntrophomonadaceae bacterium]|nr:hypothetical protein [Syntrophomonadaceae bacterium]